MQSERRIFVTGDTHGKAAPFRKRLREAGVRAGDLVIVCGDFGFVWEEPEARWDLLRFSGEPFDIAFVDGNHEDFPLLESYPVESWHGGNVHRIAGNIVHLMRGQCFSIAGRTFFTMGGAYSTDRIRRKEGTSWWPQELPSAQDYRIASETLRACEGRVDYVLTHTLPQSAIFRLGISPDPHDAELTGFLEWLKGELTYTQWFAGHFHVDRELPEGIRVVYEEMILL